MNKDESLELFKQGANAWNTWSESMLTERKVLESAGSWMQGDENQWNDETRSWHERAEADFSRHEFKDYVDFSNFHFPGNASFDFTNFQGTANFRSAKFHYNATFLDTKFFELASFRYAEFEDFAIFLQCSFISGVTFANSSFKKSVNFNAVSSKGWFSLYNVKFSGVPDFTEAHFEEAPQFDNVELISEGLKNFEVYDNLPSRWRALRRLATQAHDHERELQFFKGEIIARRRTEDKLTHARFWFGWLYQILSDFGRSIWLPLLWFGISLMFCTAIYTYQSHADWNQPSIEPFSCIDGAGDSRIAALGVSVINAFPFATIRSSDLLNQYYACLYGIQESAPVIPYVVTFASIIQFFVSAVLLFLFLLAVRNHFRIK